ncbi:MAG: lysoplasmalogenase [Myxococcota bacterium]
MKARATLPLAILAGLTTALFFAGLWLDIVELRLLSKPFPVLALALWVGLNRPDRTGVAILVGLVLSAVGDLLLEIPANLFVYGLLAFLCAHVAYIVGAVMHSRTLAPWVALPIAAYCVGVYVWLQPNMGELSVPVAVYVTVIGLMLWRMAARIDGTPWTTLALLGAVSFALSDSIIAVRKFYAEFPGVRECIMVTYWLGQALIAASAIRSPAARSPRPDAR